MRGSELVFKVMEKVTLTKASLKASQGYQRSYSNVRKGELEFDIDDWLYLNISPIKGVMHFGKKGKLSPHYVGLYKILRDISKVAMSKICYWIWHWFIWCSDTYILVEEVC